MLEKVDILSICTYKTPFRTKQKKLLNKPLIKYLVNINIVNNIFHKFNPLLTKILLFITLAQILFSSQQ